MDNDDLMTKEHKMEKYHKLIKHAHKGFKTIVIALVFLILLPIGACTGYSIYANYGETLLYTYETSDSHEISIYQKGHYHPFTSLHEFLIKYDGVNMFSFQLKRRVNEDGLFPSGNIQCSNDSNEDYKIIINYPNTQYSACEFKLSKDFQEIKYAKCWELKILNQTIKLGEYDKMDLF